MPVRKEDQIFDLKNAHFDILTSRFVNFFAGDIPVAICHSQMCTPTFFTSAFFFAGRFFSELVLVLSRL